MDLVKTTTKTSRRDVSIATKITNLVNVARLKLWRKGKLSLYRNVFVSTVEDNIEYSIAKAQEHAGTAKENITHRFVIVSLIMLMLTQ